VAGMESYYSLLGITNEATPEEIRRAYREAALRLHPDKNVRPGDTERFLEVSKAYEVLIDSKSRAEYDEQLQTQAAGETQAKPALVCQVMHSRRWLLQLGEPQVHYILLDIHPGKDLPEVRPPINLGIVIDRSTSMQGQRLDQVRSATLGILKGLDPRDTASIVAFSDRAEVVVSPAQAKDFAVARARLSLLQAGGGTELGQGLETGLKQLQASFTREGVNQLILLTDGRTYGDEELCLKIAEHASAHGITIHGMGIGADWSDRLIDQIASLTGGAVHFLENPRSVGEFLQAVFEKMGRVLASRVRLDGQLSEHVDLRSALRLLPEPMPMVDSFPISLGNLTREGQIRLLLEFVVHPIGQLTELDLAQLQVTADILSAHSETETVELQLRCTVSDQPDLEPPPTEILSALNIDILYRMQEKARHDAELGQSAEAARRLENLASHLLASGERELAKAALNEAARVAHTRRLSNQGEKMLKYGTRALLLPAPVDRP